MKELNILLVSPAVPCRERIKERLKQHGFNMYFADNEEECLEVLKVYPIDITIIHKERKSKAGLTTTRSIREKEIDTEIIIVAEEMLHDDLMEALHLGVADFLSLPHTPEAVMESIERTIKNKKLAWQVKLSNDHSDKNDISHTFKGHSKTVRRIQTLTRQMAHSECNSVLVTGESGTGKEVIAKAIHQMSTRKDKPFIAVNCSAIPEDLFESSFFGYKKGTFTGATEDRKGWFEEADGGTLMLDEIGDLKYSMQCKLLRVLDDMKIRKLGGKSEKQVDVRIIAATNQNIQMMIDKGEFRRDLYHRLTHFQIELPPLRDRKEDIPVLLEFFVHIYAEKAKKHIHKIETEIYAHLMDYEFPGNVRELRNMVERAIIMCCSSVLRWQHFEPFFKERKDNRKQKTIINSFDLYRVEQEVIKKALEENAWNKSKAAIALNITRQSLDRRILKYQIYPPEQI